MKSDEKVSRHPVRSETLDLIFSALGHPARRRILIVLHARGGVMTAGEINDRFKCSWPTTTRHLGVLKKAGLVEVQESGRQRLYSLKTQDVALAVDWLSAWALDREEGRPERRDWADLPYATMRNTIRPDVDEKDKESG